MNILGVLKTYFLQDKVIMYSMLGTVWRILFAPVSLYLISIKLTPELQGFYYLFFSIAGLQQIAEVGFSHTLIQGISYEMNKVWFNNKRLEGCSDGIGNIVETMRLGFFWYMLLALLCMLIVYPIGIFIMKDDAINIVSSEWFFPWSVFISFFSLNLLLYPVNFFFEGIQELKMIYKVRFVIQVFSSLFFIGLLFFDYGLLSIVSFSVISFLVNLIVLFMPYKAIFINFIFKIQSKKFIRKILNWQLKVGFVWCTGYLYWQLPTIVIFSVLGPVISGQYSMTANLINSIMGVGQVFVKTKAAIIGHLRASNKVLEAIDLYKKNCRLSYLIVVVGILLLFSIWIIFPSFSIFNRMFPFEQSLILSLVFGINMITINQAMFARCSKEEPFFKLSIFVNIVFPILLLACLYIAPNTWAIVFAFLLLHFIELFWGNLLFSRLINNLLKS